MNLRELRTSIPASVDHKQDFHEVVVGSARPRRLNDVDILTTNDLVHHHVRLVIGKPIWAKESHA